MGKRKLAEFHQIAAMDNDHLQTVVLRSPNYKDERTGAILTCRKTKIVQTARDLKTALVEAVTAFCRTDKGKDILKSQGGDFNLGDVAMWGQDLFPFWVEAGVNELQIHVFSDTEPDPSWEYDDKLTNLGEK